MPDDIEDVSSCARREIQRHVVVGTIQGGRLSSGDFDQIGPLQREKWVVSILGDVSLEEARIVGRGDIKTADPLPGHNLGRRPVGPGKIQSGIFCQPHSRKLPVRNDGEVVVIGNLATDFHPIVEGLGSRDGNGSFCRGGDRGFRILEEDLVGSADGISHGSVAESGNGVEEQDCEGEDDVFHIANQTPQKP